MRKMPLRSRLLRMTFIIAAVSLLLNAIMTDGMAWPLALAVMLATLVYELAYHLAMRMEASTERSSFPVPV